MTPSEVFRTYLERFTSGDVAGAGDLLTDDFRFEGPMLKVDGKAAFLKGAAGLKPIVRGCRIHRQWENGNEVCSVYDFNVETPKGAGTVAMAEWNSVRDGKLASGRLIFDTAAFNALMPETEA
jgi:ketosteroid isomerase-like protein